MLSCKASAIVVRFCNTNFWSLTQKKGLHTYRSDGTAPVLVGVARWCHTIGCNKAASSRVAGVAAALLLRPQLLQKALLTEVGILSKLTHPNLVRLCGVCLDPPLVLMEFYRNGSLFKMLQCARAAVQQGQTNKVARSHNTQSSCGCMLTGTPGLGPECTQHATKHDVEYKWTRQHGTRYSILGLCAAVGGCFCGLRVMHHVDSH